MITNTTTRIRRLAVLAFVAASVWTVPYLTHASNHAHADHHERPDHRANLQLCVQNLDGTPASQKAVGKITAAFNRVKLHRHFGDAQLDRGIGPTIMAGCPGDATIKSHHWGAKYGAPQQPATPSEISTFVFIVPQADAQRAFGDVLPRITPQEIMCEDHVCGEVTTAVYLTLAELDNIDVLTRSLSWSVGLIPEGERLPTQVAP